MTDSKIVESPHKPEEKIEDVVALVQLEFSQFINIIQTEGVDGLIRKLTILAIDPVRQRLEGTFDLEGFQMRPAGTLSVSRSKDRTDYMLIFEVSGELYPAKELPKRKKTTWKDIIKKYTK